MVTITQCEVCPWGAAHADFCEKYHLPYYEVISGPTKFYDTEGNLVEIAMSDTVVGCKSRDFCQQVAKKVLNNTYN